jgi:hypothetical protein
MPHSSQPIWTPSRSPPSHPYLNLINTRSTIFLKGATDRPTQTPPDLKPVLHPRPRNLLKIPQILRRNNSLNIDRVFIARPRSSPQPHPETDSAAAKEPDDLSSLGEYRFGEWKHTFAKQIMHRYFLCSLWPTAFALSINKQVFTFLGNSETGYIGGCLAHCHHFLRHTR